MRSGEMGLEGSVRDLGGTASFWTRDARLGCQLAGTSIEALVG